MNLHVFEKVTHLWYIASRERFVEGFQKNIHKISIWVDKLN